MKKVVVVRPIWYGKRFEEGTVVELPDKVVLAFGPRYLKPVEEGEKDADNTGKSEDVSGNNRSKRGRKANKNS